MNYMASMLRPIEGKLLEVIKDVAGAKKLRLNVEMGKKMINDIKYWEFDYTELGEMTGDEERGAASAAKPLAELDDEELEKMSAADRILATMNDDYREKERLQIMEKEQSVSEF